MHAYLENQGHSKAHFVHVINVAALATPGNKRPFKIAPRYANAKLAE